MNARNLRGAFDRHRSVSENVSLSGPLLSRFDIVLVLLDDKDTAWDDAISRHIIRSHQAAAGLAPAQQVCRACASAAGVQTRLYQSHPDFGCIESLT